MNPYLVDTQSVFYIYVMKWVIKYLSWIGFAILVISFPFFSFWSSSETEAVFEIFFWIGFILIGIGQLWNEFQKK